MRAILIITALCLTGCATKEAPVQPVSIIGSDYCQIANKLTWDIQDTRSTIDGIRRHNASWDAKCRSKEDPTS